MSEDFGEIRPKSVPLTHSAPDSPSGSTRPSLRAVAIGAAVAQIEIWQAGGMQALFMFPCMAACAMLLRVGLGLNKYVVWAIMGMATQFARKASTIVPPSERFAWWPEWGWPVGATVALSCAFGLFVVRSRQRAKAEKVA